MKKLLFVVLLLSACSKDRLGLGRHLFGKDTGVPQDDSLPPLTTVACCPPIQPSTAALCDDLLHGRGVHGVPPNIEYYINDGVHFYFPLRDTCNNAMIR